MEVIQDRANKFISDARRKKIKVGKNIYKDSDQVKQDTIPISDLSNSCFYCEKVFFSSRFLLKHILRRHAEEILLLYKKGLTHNSNNNSSDMKHLLSFLEKEFVAVKDELKIVKKAIAGENVESDAEIYKDDKSIESQKNICNIDENNAKSNDSVSEIHSNEIKTLKEKIIDLENNIQCLNDNCKELDHVLRNDVLSKQDIKHHMNSNSEKMLRFQESKLLELRETLLLELQSMLSKQLYESNSDWKLQVSELRQEIQRVDYVTNVIKEQVNSPDYMKTLEEKYARQIINLSRGAKHKDRPSKSLKSKTKISEMRVNRKSEGKIPKYSKIDEKATSSTKSAPMISHNELSFWTNEKLTQFQIPPDSSKISCAEFDKKLKLINDEKRRLKKNYANFSEVYNGINMLADHKVNVKLQNKKSRKIRFSEPLTSSRNFCNGSFSVDEKIQNKTFPQVERETEHLDTVQNRKSVGNETKQFTALEKAKFVPESEGFVIADIDGTGDYSWSYSGSQNSDEPGEMAATKSASKFKIKDIQDSQGTEGVNYTENSNAVNPIPSCSKKAFDWDSTQIEGNLTYILEDYSSEPDKDATFIVKKCLEAKNSNSDQDDFDDKASLQSLSSWES